MGDPIAPAEDAFPVRSAIVVVYDNGGAEERSGFPLDKRQNFPRDCYFVNSLAVFVGEAGMAVPGDRRTVKSGRDYCRSQNTGIVFRPPACLQFDRGSCADFGGRDTDLQGVALPQRKDLIEFGIIDFGGIVEELFVPCDPDFSGILAV